MSGCSTQRHEVSAESLNDFVHVGSPRAQTESSWIRHIPYLKRDSITSRIHKLIKYARRLACVCLSRSHFVRSVKMRCDELPGSIIAARNGRKTHKLIYRREPHYMCLFWDRRTCLSAQKAFLPLFGWETIYKHFLSPKWLSMYVWSIVYKFFWSFSNQICFLLTDNIDWRSNIYHSIFRHFSKSKDVENIYW